MELAEASAPRPFGGHFDRLIDKYSVTSALVTPGEGHWDAGKWVPGLDAVEKLLFGAIIPLPRNKLYEPGGTYTASDRHLILKSPIIMPLNGAVVVYKGQRYNIEQDTDYTDYGDVAVYVLRRVSLFDPDAKAQGQADGAERQPAVEVDIGGAPGR